MGVLKPGFWGGFLGSAVPVDNVIVRNDFSARFGRSMAAAVIGGTAAKLGGGKFANGAVSAAFTRLFNEEARRDLSISDEERAFMRAGDRKAFWESRLRRGDPLAQTALDIVNDEGWGAVANNMAEMGMKVGESPLKTLEALGVKLMEAHVSATDYDFRNNIGNVPGALSTMQIRQYHYEVFDANSIPRQFYGGYEYYPTERVYCGGCDPSGYGVR